MKMSELTSQQYYGGLNKRFDKRCALLVRAGFRWDGEIPGFRHPRFCYRNTLITTTFIMHSSKRAWLDSLRILSL